MGTGKMKTIISNLISTLMCSTFALLLLCSSSLYAGEEDLSRKILTIIVDNGSLPTDVSDHKVAMWMRNSNPKVESVTSYWTQSLLGQGAVELVDETFGKVNDGVIRVFIPYDSSLRTQPDAVKIKALSLADKYVDFSLLDTNDDGKLSSHELGITFIWQLDRRITARTRTLKKAIRFDGVALMHGFPHYSGGLTHSDIYTSSSMNTYMHELGHVLYGFMDLYNASAIRPSTPFKLEGLMSAHSQAPELNTLLSAFHTYKLGLRVGTEQLGRNKLVDINAPIGQKGARVVRVAIDHPDPNYPEEYFLVQNRFGVLHVSHVTHIYQNNVYRVFPDEHNEYHLRFLSNENTSAGKVIKNIKRVAEGVIQFDIALIKAKAKSSELLRPILRDITQSQSYRPVGDALTTEMPLRHFRSFTWSDVGADNYGFTLSIHQKNKHKVLFKDMAIKAHKVRLPEYYLAPYEKQKFTLEVTLSTFKKGQWSHKKYYYFNNYDEGLLSPTNLTAHYSKKEGGMVLRWRASRETKTGYLVFRYGFLLATLDASATSFIDRTTTAPINLNTLQTPNEYTVRAFDKEGNISKASFVNSDKRFTID